MEDCKKLMECAIREAERAYECDDVPIGCVITMDGEIIARGYNKREADGDATAHAEMVAIREACRKLGGWHLDKCEIYVTLEPCPMCMGAIVNSRIKKVVYGAKDAKAGACDSVFSFNSYPLNHKPQVQGGIMDCECRELLSRFFKEKRSTPQRRSPV